MHVTKHFYYRAYHLIKETIRRFFKADPVLYSAAIAFFTVFSLPPVLILLSNVLGWVVGERTIETELFRLIKNMVGDESAVQAINIIHNFNSTQTNWVTDVLTVLVMLFSASVIFSFFKKALNSMWGVKSRVHSKKLALDRVVSFSMVILLGFILVASLVLDVLLRYLDRTMPNVSVQDYSMMDVANVVVSFILGVITFGPMFKILPDASVKWKDVWVGATITAALFTLGKYIIGFILHSSDIASLYGAAGSFVLILLWVFYSTFTILLGGEFTLVYTEYVGRGVRPKQDAVMVETKEVIDEGKNLSGVSPSS